MKRNVVIAGAALFVVVILAWFLLLYSPLGDDLKAAETSTAVEATKTQDLQTTLTRLTDQSKNSTKQAAQLRRFDQAIPQKADEGEFIMSLSQLAVSSGVKLVSLSPTPPAASGTSSTIGLNISITGSFFQVKNYLTQLEGLERLVIIDGVNISAGAGAASSSGASSDATSLRVTLTGRMFTRAAPTSAGGVPTTTPTTPGTSTSSTTVAGGATNSTTAPPGSPTTGGT